MRPGLSPGLHQLAQSAASDGQVAGWDNTAGIWKPVNAVRSIVQGPNVTVDNADPLHPVVSATVPTQLVLVPLTTETGGEPALVWDDDNELVMTEAS